VQRVVETAVDVPVGVVLRVTDRVQEIVNPWTKRGTAERELRSYRTQLTRTVSRSERRGATARRKATTQAKRTRGRLEREVRKGQRKAGTTVRQNRRKVETTLRRNRRQAETQLRKATRQAEKVQSDLSKTVDEQTSRAQEFVSSLV
jgi:uncharacterized protein YfcZ (UPF0381/DUF406 family)